VDNINWNAVYGFWLVSEYGSFARAARALPCGTVQALHRRVRTLEKKENLNLRLLRSRGVKGVELTEAGRRLFELLSPVYRDFGRVAAELRGEDTGSLHIAATAFASNHYVGDIISRFSPQFPKVSIHFYLREPVDNIIDLVQSGRVDFGICAPTTSLADCELKASIPLRFKLFLPRGHRLCNGVASWRELLREPVILPEQELILRKAFDDLMERENLSNYVQLRAELTTCEVALDAVRAGLGIALAAMGPRVFAALRRVVPVDPPPGLPKLSLALLCKKDRHLSRYMQRFIDTTAEVFRRSENAGLHRTQVRSKG
jgi:DNA-binding transcriptional LysR family regulator